ncbi:transmembrane protein, putative (macronuclear) [Tetrahymena thermophila SB210]|uniref:Transmembrane protein, putative n=1 Tax=Tetrahymena thermophila (strain SB210) TaxID=312017 RepID=W7WVZ8_TETTS|nr:transmembrane protein, putative [Tetrahymena thermophila SB210]EWS71000.1 transmembrane protein, putative [Tetrahymena thermophila SB210]|eukprot:XP_012656463.1 transmembrane protein, putative [Tetrahymena thermophila SB210]
MHKLCEIYHVFNKQILKLKVKKMYEQNNEVQYQHKLLNFIFKTFINIFCFVHFYLFTNYYFYLIISFIFKINLINQFNFYFYLLLFKFSFFYYLSNFILFYFYLIFLFHIILNYFYYFKLFYFLIIYVYLKIFLQNYEYQNYLHQYFLSSSLNYMIFLLQFFYD